MRKDYIANTVITMKRNKKTSNTPLVGINHLLMKSGSEKLRASAINNVMKRVKTKDILVFVYESVLDDYEF